MSTPLSFKDYINYVDDEESTKTKKKLNKKSHKGRYYGGTEGDQSGMAESMDTIGGAQSPASFSNDLNGSTRIYDENEEDMDLDDEFEDDIELDNEVEEPEDPNKQGTIRVIKGAHLVYKRKDEGGTYEELWIYHTRDGSKEDIEVRRDILAGTDIPINKKKSKDGSQTFTLWSVGNVQFLNIQGLPN